MTEAPVLAFALLSMRRRSRPLDFEEVRALGQLESEHAQELDPALRLHRGPQHLRDGHDNFGVFLDSSPDRWGRVLLQRREAQLARSEERPERRLLELDYLLGVYINPVAHGDGLTLNVSETDNAQDLELARDVAKHFRVKGKQADSIIQEVRDAVSSWRDEAARIGIGRSEQDRMAPSFRLAGLD